MQRVAGASDLVELELWVHATTDRAVLVSDDGDRRAWLPLAQVEIEMTGSGAAMVTMPEWLAVDKGLV